MNVTVKIDEKFVAMAAFVKIVKKYYEGKGVRRNPKAIKKIKQALVYPEHFCRLDIDPEKVYKAYNELDMAVDTNDREFDPYNDIDIDQLSEDIMIAYNAVEKFDDTPSVNTGRFVDMVFDKTIGLYKEGIENFAPEKDDKYFMDVLDRELEIYKPRNKDNTKGADKSNPVDDKKELIETVKNEVISEITQGLPKAFEKAMYTNIK